MTAAQFRVLGPLEVRYDGRLITVPPGRGRSLLTILLLRPNQFVSNDELVDLLWDGAPPSVDRATKTLQQAVSRLRQALGPANCVRTTTNGYYAEVADLDLLRFRELADTDPHAALSLWRGPVPSLEEDRLVVLERRIDLDLERGRAAEVVPELTALTTEHPLRERFWAQLMTALHRSGRQAEALAAYERVSELLAGELGIDPGVMLRDLHHSILHAEPATGTRPVVPRQLPPDLTRFTGRTDDLARLDRLLPSGSAGHAVVISAIAGSAGVGKTALAVHWAHQVRDRFPDGQLAINLRGYDRDEPVTPHDALGRLLRGLGVAPSEVPAETEQRVGVYRSLLADRRVLVLLDNARTAEQVRPLLPAGGRSVVLVTSRSDLRGLVALHDAKVLRLGVLPLDEAVRLLERVIGANRAEPEATEELARLCACLPLALRIAGSMLASEPDLRVRDLVNRLKTGNRLTELEIGDDREAAVRAAFDLSYAKLAEDERRMFRVLGLAPKADFTPQSAGALLGVPSGRALRLLRALARAHLVDEYAPQRFSLHDLLLLHARSLAAESEEDYHATVTRYLDHHLHSANAADRAIRKVREQMPLTDSEPVVEVFTFDDADDARAWFTREHDVHFEICDFALAEGFLEHAWQLPAVLWRNLHVQGSFEDLQRLDTIALEAARKLGNPRAIALSLHSRAVTLSYVGRLDEALDALLESQPFRLQAGNPISVATGASFAHRELGQYEESLRYAWEAVERRRHAGDRFALAHSLDNVAIVLTRMGEFAQAVEVAGEAISLLAEAGTRDATVEDTLAWARSGLGDHEGAASIYRDLVTQPLAQFGNGPRIELLINAAEVFARVGDAGAALSTAREALTSAERVGYARSDHLGRARRVVRDLT